ncbi:MAG: DNA polymerase Y family protein [Pseudomonadota bacterium]
MPARRILSVWFPRFALDIAVRREPALARLPTAIVADRHGRGVLVAGTQAADAVGLAPGLGLTDARAICPDLVTRPADPARQAEVLTALRRWMGRVSPWVAEDGDDGLIADLTGTARLFGSELELAEDMEARLAQLGFGARLGIAGTPGAAVAVARFDRRTAPMAPAGNAIDQEARATRSRAAKSRPRPAAPLPSRQIRIVPPDGLRAALGPLPVAALRLPEEATAILDRLGLRRIEDIAGMPRAALARRAGSDVVRRLDQAFGAEPEPISPAAPPPHFATRLNFPEPIGKEEDILAGIDRLLPPLCAKLQAAGRGVRRIRLTATRTDHATAEIELGLARPTQAPERIHPLLALRLPEIDPGFGIDRLRLHAHVTEPLSAHQHSGHADAGAAGEGTEMAGLLDRLGARLGVDALHRLHPADSHIPERAATVMAAAFSAPAEAWPMRSGARPLRVFAPERITPIAATAPPAAFRWRRRDHQTASAAGPERLAPEWWLDDPAWRSGPRDYWRVETADGARLWLFEVRGSAQSGGWFVHGTFA